MQLLHSCIWQTQTLNKVQYPGDSDVFIHLIAWDVYWDAWMLVWLKPTVTKNMWGCFGCLFTYVTLGTVYQPQFKHMSF